MIVLVLSNISWSVKFSAISNMFESFVMVGGEQQLTAGRSTTYTNLEPLAQGPGESGRVICRLDDHQ
ncbi:hypothetical protein RRG08_042592 [Elysia crispata]|uniref:Uncharacterized protein n=1 Tax=Elysia crispata TaxID=231223 RepID=A0AAE0XQ26_9GAST|nr:hypothetical protein RRG08_042592 [Elysia crispata]